MKFQDYGAAVKEFANTKGKVLLYRTDNFLSFRTHFNENDDFIIILQGANPKNTRMNCPIDWYSLGLSKRDSAEYSPNSISMYGSDWVASFGINNEWIGANHGQPSGIVVACHNHGKTNADVGSIWFDEADKKWTLLRIEDENNLLFLSENVGESDSKYKFLNEITGALSYAESEKNNFAVNVEKITVESASARTQVRPAIRKKELSIYALTDNKRKIIENGEAYICDRVDIVERYGVLNPALISDALRNERPKVGYSKEPTFNAPFIVDYDMTFRLSPDNSIITVFNHTLEEEVKFDRYFDVIYNFSEKNHLLSGVRRYIPKLKEFKTKAYLSREIRKYDYASGINLFETDVPSDFELTNDLWEDENNPPNRQIDFIFDKNGVEKISYSTGYLPILDGSPEKRANNTHSAAYLWKSRKSYPYFISGKALENKKSKGFKFSGVSFRKFTEITDNRFSFVTIPYENDIYIYIDSHKILDKKPVDFGKELKGRTLTLIEKSDNMDYRIQDNGLELSMYNGKYGYLVFRA